MSVLGKIMRKGRKKNKHEWRPEYKKLKRKGKKQRMK